MKRCYNVKNRKKGLRTSDSTACAHVFDPGKKKRIFMESLSEGVSQSVQGQIVFNDSRIIKPA